MRKAQSARDLFVIPLVLFLFFFGVLVYTIVAPDIQTAFQTTSMNDTGALVGVNKAVEIINYLDWVVLGAFVGYVLLMIVLGFFIEVSTIWFGIYVFVGSFGYLIAWVIQIFYDNIANQTAFIPIISNFPVSNHLFSNMGLYYTILMFIGLVTTFAKTRSDAI